MVSEAYERTVAGNSGGDVHKGDALLGRVVALPDPDSLVNPATTGDRHSRCTTSTETDTDGDNPVRVRNRDGGESLPRRGRHTSALAAPSRIRTSAWGLHRESHSTRSAARARVSAGGDGSHVDDERNRAPAGQPPARRCPTRRDIGGRGIVAVRGRVDVHRGHAGGRRRRSGSIRPAGARGALSPRRRTDDSSASPATGRGRPGAGPPQHGRRRDDRTDRDGRQRRDDRAYPHGITRASPLTRPPRAPATGAGPRIRAKPASGGRVRRRVAVRPGRCRGAGRASPGSRS